MARTIRKVNGTIARKGKVYRDVELLHLVQHLLKEEVSLYKEAANRLREAEQLQELLELS